MFGSCVSWGCFVSVAGAVAGLQLGLVVISGGSKAAVLKPALDRLAVTSGLSCDHVCCSLSLSPRSPRGAFCLPPCSPSEGLFLAFECLPRICVWVLTNPNRNTGWGFSSSLLAVALSQFLCVFTTVQQT